MKKLKLYIPFLFALLFLFGANQTAEAKAGSNAKGASIPGYNKVITYTVDKKNFETSLKEACKEAGGRASNSIQYKIVIPPGTYQSSAALKLHSNVHVYAVGATVHFNGDLSSTIRTEDKSAANILIEGGTWTTIKQKNKRVVSGTMLRIAHISNLHIKNAVFQTNRGGHMMEFSDAKRLTIEGCTLTGNTVYDGVQPKEAIQLDVSTQAAMNGCLPYNGKGCHNILIRNNTFKKVARGVGSHHDSHKSIEKTPYSDITVDNNTFKNCKGEAVFGQEWKNVTVSNNKIKNARRAGIYLRISSSCIITKNTISNTKMYTGQRKKTYGDYADGILISKSSKNKFSKNTITNCKKSGIRVFESSSKNTLTGNRISKCKNSGILVTYCSTPRIASNILTKNKGYGIRVQGSNYTSSAKKLKKSNKFTKNSPGSASVAE